jgi:hypothetical protein
MKPVPVTVEREWEGHHASGSATLKGMTPDAAQRSPLARVAAARAWLAILDELADEPVAAYGAAKHALDELGTDYRGKHDGKLVTDDTGSTLRLAGMAADKGGVAEAAKMARRVLEQRLDMYLHVFANSVE